MCLGFKNSSLPDDFAPYQFLSLFNHVTLENHYFFSFRRIMIITQIWPIYETGGTDSNEFDTSDINKIINN